MRYTHWSLNWELASTTRVQADEAVLNVQLAPPLLLIRLISLQINAVINSKSCREIELYFTSVSWRPLSRLLNLRHLLVSVLKALNSTSQHVSLCSYVLCCMFTYFTEDCREMQYCTAWIRTATNSYFYYRLEPEQHCIFESVSDRYFWQYINTYHKQSWCRSLRVSFFVCFVLSFVQTL